MRFGSLFAGIGGFDVAAERAGMACLWQVENDPQCVSVLEHHWPGVHRVADVRDAGRLNLEPADVIFFGSPCQDLSVGGKRKGLAGERSGLFYEAIRIVRELSPAFAVWENVPGTFSSNAGHDFRAVLDSLVQCGARDICWRVLDAQYFGLAQRRKRVFLVADFGGQRAGQILFESPCGCGHPPKGRETGQGVARTLTSRSAGRGVSRPGRGGEDDFNLITYSNAGRGQYTERLPSLTVADDNGSNHLVCLTGDVTHPLRAEGADASEDGTGRGTPVIAFQERGREGGRSVEYQEGLAYSLNAPQGGGRRQEMNICFQQNQRNEVRILGDKGDVAGAIQAQPGTKQQNHICHGCLVRRLTPLECTRLMGFPDDWLDLTTPLSDSAKYRMLGNSVAVPVVEWVTRRLKVAIGRERL